MLIDTHAHLNDDELFSSADDVAADMEKNGLCAIINVGYDIPSSIRAADLADKYGKMFCAVGIHPHDSQTVKPEDYDLIRKLADNK
ncbi:MAG: TatD family hydrolase, partial [Christensenellales bacterium]